MAEAPPIAAAGVVVCRKGPQVLLVHRPKYDDWSFPKGKLDPDEHATTAAVREVAEETGLDVRLGLPLTQQHYLVQNGQLRDKYVDYWAGQVVGGDDVSGYRPNEEIDGVAWVPLAEAAARLTHERDRATLEEFAMHRERTEPLVILRHGKARPRKSWAKDDRLRPLNKVGRLQAQQVVPVLSAYGVRRILSSSSRRCWSTLSPYADVTGLELDVTRDLTEEDTSAKAVERHVHRLLARAEPTVLCTHKPVLPHVYEAVGVRDPQLRAGAMLVVHHRGGQVVSVELHDPLPVD
jgi:8-oxo-dGTP pyrophosphatase MutT (NUDIX family)/phosphohistidine phosphatase SixA